MYNIFTNQLKLKNKDSNSNQAARDDKESEQAMEKSTLEFIRNLKLVVKKLHVRFEDDILMPEKPYALGLVINSLVFETTTIDKIRHSLQNAVNRGH